MARTGHQLSDTLLRSKNLKPGFYHDGLGLYLQVKNGGRSWVLRYMIDGKPRYMGLGSQAKIPLARARTAAKESHALIADGIDPIEQRRKRKESVRVEAAKSVTFEAAAKRYLKSKTAEWRNAKHAAQWEATLQTYAYPVVGTLPIQAIDTGLVMKVLEPIWNTKTETATRLRQRIESVLNWAGAHGYRTDANPARWRGHLDKLLSRPSRIRKVKHFEAMGYGELPGFFRALSKRDTASARALVFTILCAARSGETRLATFEEIDFANAVWTVPGERMKSGREHRVPLTREVIAMLKSAKNKRGLIFPNADGEPLSDAAMRKYLQEDMARSRLTVHGFRSTFRDWVSERTNVAGEVAEAALGHVIGDKTEAAYRRGDLVDRRRRLMEMWSKYCFSGNAGTGKVLKLRTQ
jgi:integrase